MKKIVSLLMIAFCSTILSCSDDKDGNWDDNIQLSQKLVTVDAEESVTTITTGTDSWWLQSVYINESNISLNGIDPVAKDFIVEARDFSIERKNGNEIIITMRANTTQDARALTIGLQNGDYFDTLRVIQKGMD